MSRILILLALILVSSINSELQLPTVDQNLLAKFQTVSTVDIILTLKDSTSTILSHIKSSHYSTLLEKRTAFYQELQHFTLAQQQDILKFLESKTSPEKIQGFWITNQILVRDATQNLVIELDAHFATKLSKIRAVQVISLNESEKSSLPIDHSWGVDAIEASVTWATGYSGKGSVVATLSTGVRSTHETLASNHRLKYGWYDPTTGTETPSDNVGIGTSEIAAATGVKGIGVAPKAQWIACRSCTDIGCVEFAIVLCAQWIFCPFEKQDNTTDCSQAPDAVIFPGWDYSDWLKEITSNLWEAGTVPVIGTLAKNNNNGLESYSIFSVASCGRHFDRNSRPSRICAPGKNIKTADSSGDRDYVSLTSDSLGAAHAAGAVAILRSKDENLSCEEIVRIFIECATPLHHFLYTSQQVFDDEFGFLNVYNALGYIMDDNK